MTADSAPAASRAMRLVTIVLILAAGVLTGAQLGKVAPLIPWYGEAVGLSLVAAGWLAAVLGIFIAIAALPAGWAIDRIGLVRSILAGALALGLGGVALAAADAPATAFAARLVEAVGYLSLCIALPAVLTEISPSGWKGPVLAIWSGFVPLGFATSDFLASAMLPRFEPATYLLVMACLFAVVTAPAVALLHGFRLQVSAGAAGAFGSTLSLEVVLLAISFGAFVVLSVSLFTFLPTLVAQDGTRFLVSAGTVALTVPLGNLIAGVMVHGRGPRYMTWLALAGFAVSAVVAVPAFTLAAPVAATAAVLVLAVSGAFVASAQFAAIPFITPRRGSVPVTIGLVCQAGGIGTLFGPPLAAGVIEGFGRVGLGWFLAGVAVAGLACMLPLLRNSPRQALSAAGSPPPR